MLKKNILSPKRSKHFISDEEGFEIHSVPRKMPLQTINEQNTQKLNLQKVRNQEDWNKKEQENLIVSLFQKIVNQPYLSFSWNNFRDQENLAKISRQIERSEGSCLRKIDEIKSVNLEKYSDLKFIDFLMVYWKDEGFKGKTGRVLVEKIKELRKSKSDHMRMIQEKMKQMKAQQPTFDRLYELIMRS